MPRFTLVFSSADRRRTYCDTIEAVDIDEAACAAIGAAAMEARFGSGASWFLAAVAQEDLAAEVANVLERDAG